LCDLLPPRRCRRRLVRGWGPLPDGGGLARPPPRALALLAGVLVGPLFTVGERFGGNAQGGRRKCSPGGACRPHRRAAPPGHLPPPPPPPPRPAAAPPRPPSPLPAAAPPPLPPGPPAPRQGPSVACRARPLRLARGDAPARRLGGEQRPSGPPS